MLLDILTSVTFLAENVMIFFLLLFVLKYVFLEKLLDKNKYRKIYVLSIILIVAASLLAEDAGQFLAIIFSGVIISVCRNSRRIRGFFVVFPAIGIINGLVVPFLLLPVILWNASNLFILTYRLVIYTIMFLGLLIFETKGKKWKDKFRVESNNRQLRRWEFAVLGVVSVIVTTYSFGAQFIPDLNANVNALYVANYIKVFLLVITLFSLILTIFVILLVLQGNKRDYYSKIAKQRRERVERLSLQMVNALVNTIDAKDSYTNGHSTRVAKYSVMLAERMGYNSDQIKLIEYAALLHDIGKIGVPNEIINKTSRLTDEEYEIIKTHPVIGGNTLKDITEIPDIAIGARFHHERFDGRGYPDKLSGTDIPEIARIIGVADAYDAMTSNRSYRGLLSQETVRGEIEKGKGTQFDPEIAEIMLTIIDEDKEYKFHE